MNGAAKDAPMQDASPTSSQEDQPARDDKAMSTAAPAGGSDVDDAGVAHMDRGTLSAQSMECGASHSGQHNSAGKDAHDTGAESPDHRR